MIPRPLSLDTRRRNPDSPLGPRAFSLVEVVLALSVATFAILAIVSLLPAGIKSTKDSLDETRALSVLNEVVSDRQATPFQSSSTLFGLPALTNTLVSPITNSFGVLPNHQSTATLSQALYKVTCIETPPAAGRLDPYQLYVKVSWPAAGTGPAAGAVETVATFAQP
jgi:type II secretory pathway pseudopilin PulG